MQVESDLGRAREEFHMLAVHLWELAPDHAIFEEPAFSDKAMDDLVSLGSWLLEISENARPLQRDQK
jgi:hypothetical protein